MRRKEMEVTDPGRIDAVIRACDCCRLGLWQEDGVYIVPMNFGFVSEGGQRAFFFHTAPEGKKMDLLARRPRVSFELDTGHGLSEGPGACSYSYRYQCVMGQGEVRVLEDPAEKEEALQRIMEHCAGRGGWEFTASGLARVCLLRLDVAELTCKEHK